MTLAIIFNGQGAYYQGMGLDFAQRFSGSHDIFRLAEDVSGYPLRQWILEQPELFNQTMYAQVAITATSLAIYQAINNQLPPIAYMGGLSLGEYTALIASGMMPMKEGLQLVTKRGHLMGQLCQSLPNIPMRAIIGFSRQVIEDTLQEQNLIGRVYIANVNTESQVVVSGNDEDLNCLKQALSQGEKKVLMVPLKVEGPFHTPWMQDIERDFMKELNQINWKKSKVSVLSNLTGRPHDLEKLPQKMSQHLYQTTMWHKCMQYLKNKSVTHVIQIGPGNTLLKFLGKNTQDFQTLLIDKLKDVDKLQEFIEGIKSI